MKRFKRIIISSFIFICINVNSQQFKVDAKTHLVGLDAYAVVRLDETIVDLNAIDELVTKERYAITILKESGLDFAQKYMRYDKRTKINKFSAILYDANGNEVKKYKKKDLNDQSAVSGGTLYADDRVQFYDIVPIKYPFTIYYETETKTSNTIWIPPWRPIPSFYVGVEQSKYEFNNNTNIKVRTKEVFPNDFDIEKQDSEKRKVYELSDEIRLQPEYLSPHFLEISPNVTLAPNEFELEDVQGKYENWEQFGKWMFDNLVKGKQQLTEEDKAKVLKLVEDVESPRDKVRILYKYMQEKVRYISVQLGIGGWSPFSAEFVGEKSYGDCKALSNYMLSMLNEVGVEAIYTVIHSSRDYQINFDKDFPRMQGNHVILGVPTDNDTIWLECTSQKTPNNFLGYSTNGRYALAINDKGGKIIRTQYFKPSDNQENIVGKGKISTNGQLTLNLTDEFKGLQYDNRFYMVYEPEKEQLKYLKDKYSDIKGLNVKDYKIHNNQDDIILKFESQLESEKYGKVVGNNLIMPLIPTGKITNGIKKDDTRRFPLQIKFGYRDESHFEIDLPIGYQLDKTKEPIKIENEFGLYNLNYTVENNQLKVHREILIKKGQFPAEKFNDYIEFREQIEKQETQKILLTKK